MRQVMERLTWKWVVTFLIILAVTGGVAYASYRILEIRGKVTVEEAITLQEPVTFTQTIYPNETRTRTFHLDNAGSEAIEVHLDVHVSPKPGLDASVAPDPVTVPGGGTAAFTLSLKADSDAAPKEYTVTVTVER